MERSEEIKVMINYLMSEVTRYSNAPLLYADKIVECGKLIKQYQDELKTLNP